MALQNVICFLKLEFLRTVTSRLSGIAMSNANVIHFFYKLLSIIFIKLLRVIMMTRMKVLMVVLVVILTTKNVVEKFSIFS